MPLMQRCGLTSHIFGGEALDRHATKNVANSTTAPRLDQRLWTDGDDGHVSIYFVSQVIVSGHDR